MRVRHAESNGLIEHHVSFIQEQVDKGLRDGEARQLAVRIVSGTFERRRDAAGVERNYVKGYGKYFLAPPGRVCKSRDDACEIERIWDFVVLNFRYVYDTRTADVFATIKESLDAGGGDCDDGQIVFAVLLGHLGFPVKARVISERVHPDEPVHIYPLVGATKDDPEAWVPLDWTVAGALPGWEYPDRGKVWDFDMVA